MLPHADFYAISGFRGSEPASMELERLTLDLQSTAVFLDFDGTLVPIEENHDEVTLPANSSATLKKLVSQTDGNTAVVSGRSVEYLADILPGFDGILAGSHGAELRLPDGKVRCVDCDEEQLGHLKKAVREFAFLHDGLVIEDKPVGIVVHCRQAPELMGPVSDYCGALVKNGCGFTVQHAKMAIEIKPEGANKASIIEEIADRHFTRRDHLFFAGDDVTDESGFVLVNGIGGDTVKVGPGNTAARYRAQDSESFIAWLQRQTDTNSN